jgi:polar amino acid transport system substrate-binding protein
MRRFSGHAFLTTLLALVIAACTNAAPTPTVGPTASPAPTQASGAPSPTATGGAASATPSSGASASPAVVASVPPDQLLFADKLVICSDLPYPPQEYFDDSGNPIGSDIELGEGIAARLGLTTKIENSVFSSIILAVTGGKCDIIISAQNITPERLGQVDMIPYFQAGQAFMVQAGNPSNIQTAEDLCGKKIAVQTGTTMLDYVSGSGGFTEGGLPDVCSAAAKPDAEALTFEKDPDAVAALQAGTADAYMADLPVVIGYADASPDQFMLAPVPQIAPALEGISVAKTNTALRDAVKKALEAMIADGSYLQILTKYQVEGGALTVEEVNQPLPSPAPSPSST